MDLGLSESQQMLKNSAREFLQKECPHTYVREMEVNEAGYTPEFWKQMAEMGWMGLALPEEYGGTSGSFLDLCVLLEEMGRALVPGPFFSDIVLGALTILDAGSPAQKQQHLPKIVAGEEIATLALTEPSGRWDAQGVNDVRATRTSAGYTLRGTKLFVQNAKVSDVMVLVARTRNSQRAEQGVSLFLMPTQSRGLTQTALNTVASDKQSELVLNNVEVPGSAVVGKLNQGWPVIERAVQRAAAAKCVEMIGGAQQVLDMTVDYAKQRVQFGRPIGTFQAIQHHCANMAVEVEGAKWVAYQAAWAVSEGQDAAREVATAKAWVSEAYRKVCALGHQSHGAIGFTKEHNLQLYTRRAKAGEVLYGDPKFHKERLAAVIGV